MRVIVIKNSPQRGKTQTFNKLLGLFPSALLTNKKPLDSNSDDFYVSFLYKGKRIGFVSVGDSNGGKPLLQEKYLEDWIKQEFDIIVCACHVKKDSFDLIKRLFPDDEVLIWFSNFTSTNDRLHECLNEQSAQSIMSLINTLIDNDSGLMGEQDYEQHD